MAGTIKKALQSVDHKKLLWLAAALFAGLYMYQGLFGVTSPSFNRSMYIFFAVLLVFLNKPLKGRWAIIDIVALAALVAATVHFNVSHDRYLRTFGLPIETIDVVFGTIMVALIVETARRQLGWVMAILTLAGVGYLVFGRHMPAIIMHAGFSWNTIISELYASVSGIYGEVTYVLANYMLLFLIFGAFLNASGAGDFFLDLAQGFLGHRVGGSAKAAVGSSFIVGSVTGSAAGNVAITGIVTIPLMKKTGYEAHVAGATEATASTGGTILPPVMGAAAFIMAAMMGVSYVDIIKVAALPGVIYFISVFLHTHFYASRRGIKGLPKDQLPKIWPTLKRGYQFFIPLLVLLGSLLLGFSLNRVAMNTMISTVLVSYFRKDTRMSPRKIVDTMAEGAKTAMPILAVAGPVSVLSAALILPGTANRLAGNLVTLTGGSLGLTIGLIALIGYILGMGLDATAAYLVMATFAPPAMANLGVPLMAAHLMALWYGQLSNVTPPVAMAAYVAASISGASLWKVGVKALTMALALLYLPAIWMYRPALLLNGSFGEIVVTAAIVLSGVILLVAGFEGYLLRRLNAMERAVSFAAAVMLLFPWVVFDIAGMVLAAGFVLYQIVLWRRDKSAPAPAAAA